MSKSVLAPRLVVSLLAGLFVISLTALYAQGPQQPTDYDSTPGGVRQLEAGQPYVIIHATVEAMGKYRAAHNGIFGSSTSTNLSYHGGKGGIGVETAPKIYLVLWGSQWANDPSGEEAILEGFFGNVGASSWLNSVTQYCQGVASGTIFCNGAGTPAGNQSGMLAGIWYDNASAPTHPKQSQLAAEAVRAAGHFGNNSATANASVQYVIATAHGNNSTGFGTQYCAWHSSTSSSGTGNVAYTNLPYITDAGASCGANFNGLGPKAGITIVEGHELAETITDQFPSTGWLDGSGSENGDKCAWISSGQGAASNETFGTLSYPVQSLWSNAFNSGAGGCVLSY